MRTAQQLVAHLGLVPHPEGGYYREVYRSAATVTPGDGRPGRRAVTTIYFLLAAGQHSAWHRVQSDEVWHFYDGTALLLFTMPPSIDSVKTFVLDNNCPVHVVSAGCWQAARPTGDYSLAGCTVAPGFEFEDFTMLRSDPSARAALERLSAEAAALL